MRKEAVEVIVSTLEELREELRLLAGEVSEETVLFGAQSALDSMGLVTFLLEVEQRVEERLGVAVRLMDDRAMSQKRSPFRTVRTLADYVGLLVEEERSNVRVGA